LFFQVEWKQSEVFLLSSGEILMMICQFDWLLPFIIVERENMQSIIEGNLREFAKQKRFFDHFLSKQRPCLLKSLILSNWEIRITSFRESQRKRLEI